MGKFQKNKKDHSYEASEKPKFAKNKTNKKRPPLNRKEHKEILKKKRARLIIKNLPFKATEENLKEHFGKYGEVESVNILKKPDGKMVGCAFIQFNLVQFAKQARHYTHNQPFLGRNIEVDFAKAKDKYVKEKTVNSEADPEIKKEDDKKEVIEIKDEPDSEEDNDNSDNSEDDEVEETASQTSNQKKPFQSHDVNEGKTVFIKNVPYDATNEDLRQCMGQFGPTYYALICVDKLTEHSRGSAFVKFVNKEDADKALAAGTELTLKGNILDCHPAIDRNDLKKKEKEQKEQKGKPKDSRNLYLVKEGVILAGSKSAEGVSASDMAKRLQIEQYKTQMLRNLNTFVSKDRLVVHNLPPTWDDKKLKMLFQKHGGKGAVVREARIMRNMKKLDAKGVGESKQFGFVAFTSHEHALAALRSLNNNPNVFSAQKRPIITFSIESKTALKAKIKRQEKSRLKNPKSKDFDPNLVKKEQTEATGEEPDIKPYAGVTTTEGKVQKMRSRYKLTEQAKLHYKTLKKEKRKQKMAKKTLQEKQKQFIKQPKQKINKVKQEDNFSKMVSNYKKKLIGGMQDLKKSKWYSE
ncbi:RNA-binding protein 28 [Anthonomus grandis grandis]|uniref:RNA-binding protein 28 n=1 Tax=Anthonomus grandis grandis TaxID=2921223 RepID=UPI002166BD8B|nr:RNA-binding protein 28 [Anthonomus grandis grandis]